MDFFDRCLIGVAGLMASFSVIWAASKIIRLCGQEHIKSNQLEALKKWVSGFWVSGFSG